MRHLAAVARFEAQYPKVTNIERRINTPSGNPRYRVTIGGSDAYTTANDIADAYGVNELLGQPVEYETDKGYITRIWKAGTR